MVDASTHEKQIARYALRTYAPKEYNRLGKARQDTIVSRSYVCEGSAEDCFVGMAELDVETARFLIRSWTTFRYQGHTSLRGGVHQYSVDFMYSLLDELEDYKLSHEYLEICMDPHNVTYQEVRILDQTFTVIFPLHLQVME